MRISIDFGRRSPKPVIQAPRPVNSPPSMMRSGVDGQFENFIPAVKSKPQGWLNRIQGMYWGSKQTASPSQTTEQGASSAASPLTYPQSLIMQRYDRRASIADCRELVLSEPRARVSTRIYAYEAVRGGVTNKVGGKDAMSTRAQEIWDKHTCKLVKPSKLYPWNWGMIVEGDLFVQMVVRMDADTPSGMELVGCKRMPTVGMERLTNDADEFEDPRQAFQQIDAVTNEVVATWPEALMCHLKWDAFDGDRYGTSELIASRRQARILMLQENSQTVRRMTRAPQRKLWNIGSQENPSTEQDVNNFKANNGFVEGAQEIYDPVQAATDFFSNGMTTCQVLEGDKTIAEIDDLRYTQDVYAASLPTPSALYNLNAGDINRDVLTDLHMRFLQATKRCNEALEDLINFIFDLDLLLNGIDPRMIERTLFWTKSTIETVGETVKWICEALEKGAVSTEVAVRLMQEFTGVTTPEEEVGLILKEMQAKAKIEASAKPAPATSPGVTSSRPAAKSSARGDGTYLSGHASNGHSKHSRSYEAAEMDEDEVADLALV